MKKTMRRNVLLCMLIAVVFLIPTSAVKNRTADIDTSEIKSIPAKSFEGSINKGNTYAFQTDGKITVVTPNGGEVWAKGEKYYINWVSEGNVGNKVWIELKSPSQIWVITSSLTNHVGINRYLYEVSTDLPNGSHYKITITDTVNQIDDESDGYFTIRKNQPPYKPDRPCGEPNVEAGKEYTYSSKTNDPDEGEQLRYQWDWGDGTRSEWSEPYEPGKTCKASHIWKEDGTYEIRVRAKDICGVMSNWSEPAKDIVPKNRPFNSIFRMLDRFINCFPFLEKATLGIKTQKALCKI